jgi:hypothetical protein
VAGVGQSLLIILLTVSISLVAVLSAVGISERANIDCHGGGVYSLLRHVIGARISAAMAIVYCFGQVRHFGFQGTLLQFRCLDSGFVEILKCNRTWQVKQFIKKYKKANCGSKAI